MNDTFNNTEEIGIDATKRIITQEFKWIFREKTKRDIGVDAEAETKLEGLLIQIQIKTGIGNFKTPNKRDEGLTYYVDKYHYDYWTKLKAPVLFVAHLPQTNKTYWQIITQDNLQKTSKQWKLFIPYLNELNIASKDRILYNCIKPIDPEILFIPNIEEKKATYRSNVISVDSLGGFNSLRAIEYRQQFARKAHILQKISRLRDLAYSNPMNFTNRIELCLTYIEMNDVNNAVVELNSLITTLNSSKKDEFLHDQVILMWAKYYLHLITQQKNDYKSKIENTSLIMLAKIKVFGKDTSFLEPCSIEISQHGQTFKMISSEKNHFILTQQEQVNSILNNGNFKYEVFFDVIPNQENIIPQIENCSCEFELGLMCNNEHLQNFSTLIPKNN